MLAMEPPAVMGEIVPYWTKADSSKQYSLNNFIEKIVELKVVLPGAYKYFCLIA